MSLSYEVTEILFSKAGTDFRTYCCFCAFLSCWCSFVKMLFTAAGKMFSSSVLVQPEVDPSNSMPVGFMNPVLASCQVRDAAQDTSRKLRCQLQQQGQAAALDTRED